MGVVGAGGGSRIEVLYEEIFSFFFLVEIISPHVIQFHVFPEHPGTHPRKNKLSQSNTELSTGIGIQVGNPDEGAF